jgi:hypothetical protein
MSGASTRSAREPWAWLPARLRPRAAGSPAGRRLWLVETTLLALAGLLLATATINDLVRQTHINHRLIADLRTWRSYTGHSYRNLSTEQEALGPTRLGREVVCGNTAPGAPRSKPQICLAIWGPVVDGRRTVHGGWYVPARSADVPAVRYGCFGEAGRGRCAR